MTSVSVVIPCYKYGHYLDACTRSVLDDQPGVDVKVLIIDDASPDDSAEVAREIARRDPRVEVAVHPANRGHIATYNEGLLEWADRDYSVLLSADDLLTPGALTRATGLLDAHPDVAFVYGHPIHFDSDLPLPPARTGSPRWTVWDGDWWLERRFREATGCVTCPEVVVRTDIQKRVGGYDPELPATGDMEMWMRMAVQGRVGYLRGVDQAYYRVHRTSMSKTTFAPNSVDLRHRKLAYDRVLAEYGELLPDTTPWADLVNKRLAKDALWEASRAFDRGRTASVPVDDLEEFARTCWSDVERLPGYWTYRLRRMLGAERAPYLQPVVLSAVVHKIRTWLWWKSWERRGI